MPSITISSPTAGSTVDRPVGANGTYTAADTPTIRVVLKDVSGAVVANGFPIAVLGGT